MKTSKELKSGRIYTYQGNIITMILSWHVKYQKYILVLLKHGIVKDSIYFTNLKEARKQITIWKYQKEYQLWVKYPHSSEYEEETAETTYKDIKQRQREYHENVPNILTKIKIVRIKQ